MDCAKAGESGAANQLQQKRLGLVVTGVAHGNSVRRDRFGNPVKKGVPQPTGGVFDRQSLRGRVRSYVNGLDGQWKTDTFGKLAAEPLVAHRRASKAMIQVGEGDDREPMVFGKLLEQEHERNGVGSTREADQQASARRAEIVAANRAADLLMEVSHVL